MAQVKVGIATLADPDKVQYARQLVLDMTGNPNFTTPAPSLASVGTAATTLETAFNAAQTARQVAKSKTQAQDAAAAALLVLVSQLANYVENTSAGDPTKITSSGFALHSASAPIGPLTPPQNLQALGSDMAGTMNLKWVRVRGAKSYVIERALDASTFVWVPVASSTKSKATVNTMTSGLKYWFRVSALGAAGESGPSNLVAIYAP